ncbi:PorP/SprF family type IX secretion system membrane protein [Altibacter sp. HG106]|uniref:PorP/SprF family type IX secretion system membrane protein n=1 Tax=Altibacter sp. HG106 TaxID=3023937 RepID=UPI00234FB6DB|nr:type IX secretion system membrane protein PorP/SprF [Altibacter sp. HG106]MDC7993569.1 type IX secretion system membrane protein PorP/SprF [Altibacter sp. HG106]
MKSLQSISTTVFLLSILWISSKAAAQQDPQYTQYLYNTMSINPAYAGSLETLDVVGTYRDQWVGIDGAPNTQNLGIHTPLRNEKIGVGINISHDRLGPSREVLINGNFSYKLQLSPTLKLGLGIKAGADFLDIDFSEGIFQDPNDPVLNTNVDNRTTLTLGTGAYLYSNNWYLGLSVPDFITDSFYDNMDQSVSEEELQYYMIGGYVFDVSTDFRLKPAFLLKYLRNTPIVVDVSANVLYRDRLTFGVSYRYEDAISGIVGVQVIPSVFVGYSYDYTLTDLSDFNDGTHEIVLRFTLVKQSKRINSPRFF